MKYIHAIGLSLLMLIAACDSINKKNHVSKSDEAGIRTHIQQEIDEGVEATRTKNIDVYMSQLPDDLVIHDENGTVISKEMQRANALRDWSIIDTTLAISMDIDSIQYARIDSIIVFTSQRWERLMFRRDGVTTDTVLTTQKHRETWKKNERGWFAYDIVELGGDIFINGEPYRPE